MSCFPVYSDAELDTLLDRSDLLGNKDAATITSINTDLFEVVEQIPAAK
jgi:hypothetical protein